MVAENPKMKSYAAVMEIWLCDNGMESLEESLLWDKVRLASFGAGSFYRTQKVADN